MTHPSRRPLVAANWKMNLGETGAADLATAYLDAGVLGGGAEVFVAPPFPFLRRVLDRLRGSSLAVAAQNAHWEDRGAFTGEVSPRMLAEMGVGAVILGHSERRHGLGEADEIVGRKVQAALRNGLAVVLCVGELESERDAGRTLEVVARQLRHALAHAEPGAGRFSVAYEPVWAIGTGRNAAPTQIAEVHEAIRAEVGALLGHEAASSVRVLYGGSVSVANAPEILGLEAVDGALVGGASLDAATFATIVRAA